LNLCFPLSYIPSFFFLNLPELFFFLCLHVQVKDLLDSNLVNEKSIEDLFYEFAVSCSISGLLVVQKDKFENV
jgi:hypothetical protein